MGSLSHSICLLLLAVSLGPSTAQLHSTISSTRLKSLLDSKSLAALPKRRRDSNGSPTTYIIGGFDAPKNEFPFVAQIMYWGNFVCGGTLTNWLTVVTAKHCVDYAGKQYFKVRLGEYDRSVSEGTEEDLDIKEIRLHPTVDIAVIHLAKAPRAANRRTVSGLATSVTTGSMAIALGWGWMMHQGGGSSAANILQLLMLPVQPASQCTADGLDVTSTDICAGYTNGYYVNVCHGDSGGPLVVADGNGGYKLLGVISRGHDECPEEKHHALYISVPALHTWITQNTAKVCFPGDANVQTVSGRSSMSSLQRGELVQTVTQDGVMDFSPVIGFLHQDAESPAVYLQLETSLKGNITLSPFHLIFRAANGSRKFSEAEAVYARSIQLKDRVFITTFEGLKIGRVRNITEVVRQGVFAPLTEHGTVVVDGVVASCYALVSHRLAHASLAPLRWAQAWAHWLSELSFSELSSSSWIDWGDPTIHWYPRLLMAVFSKPLGLFQD